MDEKPQASIRPRAASDQPLRQRSLPRWYPLGDGLLDAALIDCSDFERDLYCRILRYKGCELPAQSQAAWRRATANYVEDPRDGNGNKMVAAALDLAPQAREHERFICDNIVQRGDNLRAFFTALVDLLDVTSTPLDASLVDEPRTNPRAVAVPLTFIAADRCAVVRRGVIVQM